MRTEASVGESCMIAATFVFRKNSKKQRQTWAVDQCALLEASLDQAGDGDSDCVVP